MLAIGTVISLILGFYALIEKGFFASFFVSPSQYQVSVNMLNDRISDQEKRIIKLEVMLDNAQKLLNRVEIKIDNGFGGENKE